MLVLFLFPVAGTIKLPVSINLLFCFRLLAQTRLLSVSHSAKPEEDYRRKGDLSLENLGSAMIGKVCLKMNYSEYMVYLKPVHPGNCEKLVHIQ